MIGLLASATRITSVSRDRIANDSVDALGKPTQLHTPELGGNRITVGWALADRLAATRVES